jgi:hypothetical protein
LCTVRRTTEVIGVHPFRPAVAARLAELAPHLLGQLDAVTERMVEVLLRTEPAYRELAAGSADDLRASVRANVEQGMRALIGTRAAAGGRAPAREVGRRRAAQGIPLEAVLRAYRLGGQVTWEALLAAARLANGGDDPLLLEVAGWVWRTNDRECGEVAEGYRDEQRRRAAADEEARRRALDALLDGRGGDGVLRAHAELLGLPPRGRLLVVVAMPGTGGRPALSEPGAALQGPGVRAVWGTRSVAQVGLVSLGVRRPADVVARLDGLTAGPVGVSAVVDRVTEISEAFRLAECAVRTLPPAVPRVATIDDRLPEALVSNSPEIHSRLVGQSFGRLLELPDEERSVLMDTLAAFLAADGSPTRAADALYCHRNTVMHRLRRIESVTGRKVTDPRSRLLWQLALLGTSA